jgi:hypothetical protein
MKLRSLSALAVALAAAAGVTACGDTTKAGTGGSRSSASSQIRAARASSPDFKIFPLRVSSVPCSIPRGGPVAADMSLDGTCATRVRVYHPPKGIHGGHGTSGIVEVTFSERWRFGGPRWRRSTYVVLVRHGHVLKRDTRWAGADPPQSWW